MTLDIAQSSALLIIALLMIVILLRILVVVHKQNHTVRELEMRMKAMEKLDAQTFDESQTTDTKEG